MSTPFTQEEFAHVDEAFRDAPDTSEAVEIRGLTVLRLLATARLAFVAAPREDHPDTARLDKLFRLLPFKERHRFGGDLQEFREGIDATPDSEKAP